MLKSLQALVLYSVPIPVLMDMLSTLWNLPMGKACLTALSHRTRREDRTRLAKQLPWDHPIALPWITWCIDAKWRVSQIAFWETGTRGPSLTPFFVSLFRFLDHPRMPSRLPHLSVGCPSQLWIRLQSLCAHDGWVDDRRFDSREWDQFINGRGCGSVCSSRRPNESGLGRLAPTHDLSN